MQRGRGDSSDLSTRSLATSNREKAPAPKNNVTPDRQAVSVGKSIALRCLYIEALRLADIARCQKNKEREVQKMMLDIKSDG